MQERREQVRLQAAVLVEFTDPSTSEPQRSFTHDLSLSGMRFPTSVQFQLGQEVPFTLDMASPQPAFHATGRIVWVREVAQAGGAHYEVGVRFHWVEDPDQQRLDSFLRARVSS